MKILIEVMDQNFATKTDLQELRTEMQTGFRELRTWTETGFRELKTEIEKSEYKLTIKLGAMMTVAMTVLTMLVKLV